MKFFRLIPSPSPGDLCNGAFHYFPLRPSFGKLGEEVFVDTAEHAAGPALQFVRLARAEKLTENLVVEFPIFTFGQDATKSLVVAFDGVHGLDDGPGAVVAVSHAHEVIELCFGLKKDSGVRWP